MNRRSKVTQIIRSEADIPVDFANEADEAAYWNSARFTDAFLKSAEKVPEGILPPVHGRTRPLAIRAEEK